MVMAYFFMPTKTKIITATQPKQTTYFINNSLCIECHKEQTKRWLGSDHEKAMQVANKQTVLGNFNNFLFTDAGIKTRFFKKEDKYFINTLGAEGKYADFEVKYTFGIKPLQQYLLALPKGRLQAFTVAWNTEKKQWFDLYPEEAFKPNTPLHWSSVAFTANSSCMECHMTNMALNYDLKTASYKTTWSEVNVSCQSCHGAGSHHLNWAKNLDENQDHYPNKGLVVNYKAMSAQQSVESCARCHSRRYSVSKNDAHGRNFFDDFMPELLREGLYYSDGQILDEVYVYGSFTQSKMYQQGVSCFDCHNPHTLKVREENNNLCTRCHQKTPPNKQFSTLISKQYDSPSHHFHSVGSTGSQCVNCHMPETTYMQIDSRRDHSFSIPRPDISKKWNVPNACSKCHDDRTQEWAITAMNQWYGGKWRQRSSIAEVIAPARLGKTEVVTPLINLIKSPQQAAIIRATGLELLSGYGFVGLDTHLASLSDDSALIRTTALHQLENLPNEQKFNAVIPLLNDSVQGVRIEAARLLASLPKKLFTQQQWQQLKEVLNEYKAAQMALADHPEGHLNLGNLYATQGQAELAIQAYRQSIQLDSYFLPSYSALANLYYAMGQQQQAVATFEEGLSFLPESGNLHYSLSLLLVEQQQLQTAEKHLKKAAVLMPNQAAVHYNYGLLLQKLNKRLKSEKAILKAYQLAPNNQRIINAIIIFYQQQKQPKKAEKFIQILTK
jgi:predicted CXXCH cytochrome family protein